MKHLLEMARIISANQPKRLEIFHEDLMDRTDANYLYFFRQLQEQNYQLDEDAVKDIYGVENPSDARYKMLKTRVKKRLLNSLFFLERNAPQNSELSEVYYECLKGVVQIEVLGTFAARSTAIEHVKKILHKASEYQLTVIELHCLRLLKRHASQMGDSKELQNLVGTLSKCLEMLNAELEGENLLDEVAVHFMKSLETNEQVIELTERNAELLDDLRKKYNRNSLQIAYFRVRSMALELRQHNEECINICSQAELYFKRNPKFFHKSTSNEFGIRKLNCSLKLRDYVQGKKYATQCLKLVGEETNNWFIVHEIYFLLAMHSDNYKKAEEIYGTVVTADRFTMQPEHRQEKWRIFEGYLEYLRESERHKRKPKKGAPVRRRFDIYNFIKEVPIYSKDKRGYYIAITILQILFLIEWEDLDEIIKRIESLRRYVGRYLRKGKYYRSECFMNMLIKMERRDFDPAATVQATKALYAKLNKANTDASNNVEDLEIIPYDILWERILTTLKRIRRNQQNF